MGNIVQAGYLVDLPVAKVALAFSSDAVRAAKKWSNLLHSDTRSLPDYLLRNNSDERGVRKENRDTLQEFFAPNPVKLAAIVRFTANLSRSDFLALFDKPFEEAEGVSSEEFRAFRETLRDVIGKRKILAGEEVSFYWFENGDLMILKEDEIRGILHLREINKPLLEAFVSRDKTIVSGLSECVERNIPNMRVKEREREG